MKSLRYPRFVSSKQGLAEGGTVYASFIITVFKKSDGNQLHEKDKTAQIFEANR